MTKNEIYLKSEDRLFKELSQLTEQSKSLVAGYGKEIVSTLPTQLRNKELTPNKERKRLL